MTRIQKLQWYVNQLMTDGAEAEKAGDNERGVTNYLKAVDILLLLSKNEENYTTWKNYTDKAEFCQKKVRLLVAKQSLAEEKAQGGPPTGS